MSITFTKYPSNSAVIAPLRPSLKVLSGELSGYDLISVSRDSPKWYYDDGGNFTEAAKNKLPSHFDADTLNRLGWKIEEEQDNSNLSNGLVSLWRFDGDALDSAGGNDGTINGDPQFVDGISDQALDFDRSSDEHVSHGSISFADAEAHSYSVWMQWNGGAIPSDFVLPFGGVGEVSSTIYLVNNGNILFRYRDSTGSTHTVGSYTEDLFDGNLHHVCWRVKADRTVELYIDNVLEASAQIPNTSIEYTGIGLGYDPGETYGWDGPIDEPRIYNRVLTESEIQTLFEHPIGTTRAPDNVTLSDFSIINTRQGTFKFTFRTANGSGTQTLFDLYGDTNNRIYAERNASDEIHFIIVEGGTTQADLNLGTVANDTEATLVVGYKKNDIAASLDGGAEQTDSSATIPTTTALNLMRDYNDANYWNGYLKDARYWEVKRPNLNEL